MTGRVVHFEIPADDVARAGEFYRTAFGWNLAEVPGMDYTIVTTVPTDERGMPTEPGGINGGMMRRQPPVTSPVITIDVDDIDKALEVVAAAGGATVLPRQAVGEMGFTAYVTDTEGNLLGLWQNAPGPAS